MAGFFREPNRRQMERVPADDIVHLILDVVEGMDLSRLEGRYQVGVWGCLLCRRG